jgi:hypothetical protein
MQCGQQTAIPCMGPGWLSSSMLTTDRSAGAGTSCSHWLKALAPKTEKFLYQIYHVDPAR